MKSINKLNSPRLESAVVQACAMARDIYYYSGCHPYILGWIIFNLAYKADRYDVLNALCYGVIRKAEPYIRGDIRHTYLSVLMCIICLLFIIVSLVTFLLGEPTI